MNARDLFDQGATVSQTAAETGISHAAAAYICRPMAPRWPTFRPEALAALPEHVRRMIEASNPNHKKATP
jgi:hypothetical protein